MRIANITKRDMKFFEVARKAALGSDFKTKIGACAVLNGRVIAAAASSEKTSPLQMKYNVYRKFQVDCADCLPKIHAEISLVSKLKHMPNIEYKRLTVYVYRICKSRDHGMARPCDACIRALMDLGIRNIKYTTDYGYAHEWFDKEIDKYRKLV